VWRVGVGGVRKGGCGVFKNEAGWCCCAAILMKQRCRRFQIPRTRSASCALHTLQPPNSTHLTISTYASRLSSLVIGSWKCSEGLYLALVNSPAGVKSAFSSPPKKWRASTITPRSSGVVVAWGRGGTVAAAVWLAAARGAGELVRLLVPNPRRCCWRRALLLRRACTCGCACIEERSCGAAAWRVVRESVCIVLWRAFFFCGCGERCAAHRCDVPVCCRKRVCASACYFYEVSIYTTDCKHT